MTNTATAGPQFFNYCMPHPPCKKYRLMHRCCTLDGLGTLKVSNLKFGNLMPSASLVEHVQVISASLIILLSAIER